MAWLYNLKAQDKTEFRDKIIFFSFLQKYLLISIGKGWGGGGVTPRPPNNFGRGANIPFGGPPTPNNPPTFSFNVYMKQLKLDHKCNNLI